MFVSYAKWEHPPASLREALRAGKLLVSVEVFNERFEIIFVDLDDPHLALRILEGIRCMRGINHDRLSELLSNRTRRRFCRIGGAEHIANFAHRIDPFVNNGDRFFGSRTGAFVWT